MTAITVRLINSMPEVARADGAMVHITDAVLDLFGVQREHLGQNRGAPWKTRDAVLSAEADTKANECVLHQLWAKMVRTQLLTIGECEMPIRSYETAIESGGMLQ